MTTTPKTNKQKPATQKADDPGSAGVQAEANPQEVEVWPVRTYQDAGEIKRRGGASYSVPKRHADALMARGLATNVEPKD